MRILQTRTSFAVAVSILAVLLVRAASAETEVLTRSYDNNRTGSNTAEKIFSPAKVREFGLKRLFKIQLEQDDPRVEAQL
jgi:hypothetical protein